MSEKIRFLIRSTNAHGIHSPFVFAFYNAVKKKAKSLMKLNQKHLGFKNQETRILHAIYQHLNPSSILVLTPNNEEAYKAFFKDVSALVFVKNLEELDNKAQKFDFIYISNALQINNKNTFEALLPFIQNHTAVIIPQIHASKEAIMIWKMVGDKHVVKLSLDLFFMGLLFFRKESTKQHFVLRF
ncbi:MAG: hypothetical protein JW857_02850 [Bacteroidales bacterium]|nr:hypothetical protein [Bacteroidales bacterium]